ncbi:SURF1 family protein [Undibacterium sp.]|jgi:surfeit locus 1 family protein|uniref:SURF1 family protein n=1 Tax=Undibacterium sp. TaxID=1914977 RepID=UPI002BA562A2|nr:SURF1 family protein [Undibacterium sp.]HTD02269.1 SURF1 family protein [Undibacterium sp.]
MSSGLHGALTDGKFTERAATLDARPLRSVGLRLTLAICAGLVFASFVALGTWQLKRLQWKLDLIERVEQRAHAPAAAAPGQDRWPQINTASDEYRHVRVTGTFLYGLTVRVQASTELGSGFWLLTPLRSEDGSVVLVNRGFVPAKAGDWARPDSQGQANDARGQYGHAGNTASSVTGLMRMSEPGGAFLRHNDPAANRWYSRDIAAIAAAVRLPLVAPYFIDADAAIVPADEKAGAGSADKPIGGLTVIAFHNNHLVYALTWYALALMVAGGCLWGARKE